MNNRFSVVVYDIEIINPTRPKELKGQWLDSLQKWQLSHPDEEIQFCDGWTDFKNMGIACICAYDYLTGRYRVFLKDNLNEFAKLIKNRDFLVGYNNLKFDDCILRANNIETPNTYDLLDAIWTARAQEHGLNGYKGTGLDMISKANGGQGKSGDGMMAALNWQMGKYGETIDYCLDDVKLTKELLDILSIEGTIVDAEGNILHIDLPWVRPY